MKKIILIIAISGYPGLWLMAQSFELKELAQATFTKAIMVADTMYSEERETGEMVPKIFEAISVSKEVLFATKKLNAGPKVQITGFAVTDFISGKEFSIKSDAITPKMQDFFISVIKKNEATDFENYKATDADGNNITIDIPAEKQPVFSSFYFKNIEAKSTEGKEISIPGFRLYVSE